MDKNYNVDDILSEIKRRKAEQAGRVPARPNTPAAHTGVPQATPGSPVAPPDSPMATPASPVTAPDPPMAAPSSPVMRPAAPTVRPEPPDAYPDPTQPPQGPATPWQPQGPPSSTPPPVGAEGGQAFQFQPPAEPIAFPDGTPLQFTSRSRPEPAAGRPAVPDQPAIPKSIQEIQWQAKQPAAPPKRTSGQPTPAPGRMPPNRVPPSPAAPEATDTGVSSFSFTAPDTAPPAQNERATFTTSAGRAAPQPEIAPDFSAFRSVQETPSDQNTRVLPVIEEDPGLAAPAGSRRKAPADTYYEEDGDADNDLSEPRSIDFSEYNSVNDRRDVALDIAKVKLWLFIRLSVTALLSGIVVYLAFAGGWEMTLPASIEPVGDTVRGYLLTCTVLTALVALVNSSSVGGGLLSLLKMRANSDTLCTLALLAVIGQGVAGVVAPERADPAALGLYFPVAVLAMLFNAVGKMIMLNRIQSNFRVLSSDKPKKALLTVEDDSFCREFVPEATRRPTIAYSAPADFFTDFLALSYSDKYDVGINRTIAPVCLVGSVVVGVVCYLLTESSFSAISAFAAVLSICASFSSTFIENIPLGKLAGKLTPEGGMVSGNKAVEDFCDAAAVILTENDLFPTGHVRLRGIKTFSQARIDESIRDAASVMCSLEGALSPVFLQMIGSDRGLLKKVDSVVYENGMGVSAWVDGRRVLIGNRQLMVNHGIAIPKDAAQGVRSKNPEESGELLFLSSAGEITAQFAVSYHIDEDLAAQLDYLAVRETLLLIYTTDANITARHVCGLYGYPEEFIRILPAERHKQYRRLSAHRKNAIAEIVCTGKASTMVGAVVACVNARGSILSATVLQLAQMAVGYGIVAFMAFMGRIDSLSMLFLGGYQLFWFVVILIVQKMRQP